MRTLACVVVALCSWVSGALADADAITADIFTISNSDLGRPYTAAFTPINGAEGRSLYPSAKAPRKMVLNKWEAELLDVRDTLTLRANATAWGIVDIKGSVNADTRYLVYRVRLIEYALELDDTSEARALASDKMAAYYVRRVYYGRTFELVTSGTRLDLNASIVAQIKGLGPRGGAEFVKGNSRLTTKIQTKGLKPTSEALFATTMEEIRSAYGKDADMGAAVPIMVEYRQIPGASVESQTQIDWTPPQGASTVRSRMVIVDGKNREWNAAGVRVGPDDLVIGIAEGAITYTTSKWDPKPPAQADAAGAGGLEFRIGSGKAEAAGKGWASAPTSSGELALRVRDTNYADNSGEYKVFIVVVPKSQAQSQCQMIDKDGVGAPCK